MRVETGTPGTYMATILGQDFDTCADHRTLASYLFGDAPYQPAFLGHADGKPRCGSATGRSPRGREAPHGEQARPRRDETVRTSRRKEPLLRKSRFALRFSRSDHELGAYLAANAHSRPAAFSLSEPHNVRSDVTYSLVRHHPATLRNYLTVKQVH